MSIYEIMVEALREAKRFHREGFTYGQYLVARKCAYTCSREQWRRFGKEARS